jgi:hypothetical protein
MAAMFEERSQKNIIGSFWIWSVFSSSMAAISLCYKSQWIDCKPPITSSYLSFIYRARTKYARKLHFKFSSQYDSIITTLINVTVLSKIEFEN